MWSYQQEQRVLHSPRACQAKHMDLAASTFDAGSAGFLLLLIFSFKDLHVTAVMSLNSWNRLLTKLTLLMR